MNDPANDVVDKVKLCAVMGLLERAWKNGKGIIGMKIFGNVDNVSDGEHERSIRYALQSDNVPCMTLGMTRKLCAILPFIRGFYVRRINDQFQKEYPC
jgi:hypothetical protein